MSREDRSIGWGAVMLVAGGAILLIATGVFPSPRNPANAPWFVLALAGIVFAAGGAALMLPPGSRVRLAMVAVLVAGFAVAGAWAAATGSADTITGGLFFLSRETNALLGRIVFGFGSAVSAVILVVIFRQLQ
ncbi:MAG: hypothetical protein ABFS14_02360 [Gemmatimonadota bacterium]